MTCFSNCKSNKVVNEKIIYYVPDVDWPDFPKLDDYEINEDGKITTDENYFRKILVFRAQYEDALDIYNDKKEKMEEQNEL